MYLYYMRPHLLHVPILHEATPTTYTLTHEAYTVHMHNPTYKFSVRYLLGFRDLINFRPLQ